MAFWLELEQRYRRWRLIDAKLAQAAAFCLALVVAKSLPQLLSISVWWFVALFFACALRPAVLFFR